MMYNIVCSERTLSRCRECTENKAPGASASDVDSHKLDKKKKKKNSYYYECNNLFNQITYYFVSKIFRSK